MAARRKLSYSGELADEIVAGIAVGLTDKDAAGAAGISEDTFGRWMKGQRGAPADLADRVTMARPQRARRWLGTLSALAADGDVKALTELLDRCEPHYRKRTETALTGPDGAALILQFVERSDGPA